MIYFRVQIFLSCRNYQEKNVPESEKNQDFGQKRYFLTWKSITRKWDKRRFRAKEVFFNLEKYYPKNEIIENAGKYTHKKF